ncbi:MAG TPA: ion transporter [Candidatus Paceibacterota bacterium]
MVSEKQKRDLREQIHFYFEDIETPLGRAIDFFVIGLVIIASVIFVFETYENPPFGRETLELAETIIMSLFVAEYLLRFWVSDQRKRHFFSVYSLIDLLTILPFLFVSFHLQVLQVFRIFRILRLVRYFQTAHLFAKNTGEDIFLAIRLFFTFFSITFISSGFLFYAEHPLNGAEFSTFFDAFYFSIVALTTVGFGDIAPITQWGRVITIVMILSGAILIPWQLSGLIRRLVRPA